MNRSSIRSLRSLPGLVLVALVACGGGSDDGNSPLAVTLTAPATGATGVAITLSATATDAVAKVEFFDGATALGEDSTQPLLAELDARHDTACTASPPAPPTRTAPPPPARP